MVTPQRLRRLAGARSFERGEDYFADGVVRSFRPGERSVKATVQGTRRYSVRLWLADDGLEFDCTCPVARSGEFCKHCVAVGLAWHSGNKGGQSHTAEGTEPGSGFGEEKMRDYLLGLEKDALVALLIDQAGEDERLHRRLMLRAASTTPGEAVVSAWREAFDGALETDEFVSYGEAGDYASGLEEVIDSLDDMLRAGQEASVIGLAEYAIESIDDSLGYIDDSDGDMSGLIYRLQELHLEACRRVRPDPVELAERLFEAEMESSTDAFHRAPVVYAEVLGKDGLAAYRRLAEAEWAKVPALQSGDDDPNRYGHRYRISAIMEAFAQNDNDLDALVAVKSRDLSRPFAFLEIAQLHREAGNPDLALEWAERGWQAFAGRRRDWRLRDFIADAYQDRGRGDDAVALMWDAFVEGPTLKSYQELERHARRARRWPELRERALRLVRESVSERTAEKQSPAFPWEALHSRDRSLLVQIFLYEKDSDAAWREAQTGGCSQGLWLALAKDRERDHPDDAVRIYRRHVTGLLRNTGDSVYQEAVGYLENIRAVLLRTGDDAGFGAFLAELRTTHKRKRNLMKSLDAKGW